MKEDFTIAEAFIIALLFFQKSSLRLQHLRYNLNPMVLLILNYPIYLIINHRYINLI
jgi:hypothetical protein